MQVYGTNNIQKEELVVTKPVRSNSSETIIVTKVKMPVIWLSDCQQLFDTSGRTCCYVQGGGTTTLLMRQRHGNLLQGHP
jgi:2-phospho-L-lactate guanylyltransferase (CobY/MobA/RfbA family)